MWGITGSKMSGIFSVPFAALAVFLPDHGRLIWTVLAVTSIVIAFYLAWVEERKKSY